MEEQLQVISLNLNGLNDVRKRRLTFTFLKKFKKSVFLLQETHCRPGNANLWKSQWPGHMLLTEGSGSQGGVAILFSKDLSPKISNSTIHSAERFISCRFELYQKVFTVVSVYMPTADHERIQLETLKDLEDALELEEESEIFIGGDFNVALDPNLDRKGYKHPNIHNVSFRDQLILFLERLNLTDVWRIQNPSKRAFSWSRGQKLSRLDYIFAPRSFLGVTKAKQPLSCSFSDHRLVSLSIWPQKIAKGKGFWKMQTFIIEREDFRLQLREFLTQQITNTIHLADDIRWEFIKLKVREFSIQYYSKLKEDNRRLERELEKRLISLEVTMQESQEAAEEYHATKRELLQLQLLAARQAMLRSRSTWLVQGDRPTKFFLNLEKKNFNDKTISSIYNEEGLLLSEQEDILKFEKQYFQTLHSSEGDAHPDLEVTSDPFCSPPPPNSILDDMERGILNEHLTLEELEKAAKMMKNGKSPGCDGIPIEFYKAFWDVVGPLLLASFLHSIQKGILTPNQRRAMVTMIPKKNRDTRHISNWRPISVLNVDYKIFAKSLALRLANIVPKLTHHNQTGFVPSRFIGDGIKNIHSIIDFLNETGRKGLIVSLDFRAAFDSIHHSFLFRVLETYNLGANFLSWIKTLYTSSESCILNHGCSTGWFNFQRGIRQGCPISPFLFVLAVERLADSIRANPNIRGIDLLSSHTKIQQFADDSTLFVEDEESLLTAFDSLHLFEQYSGLALNLSKTVGLNIGEIQLRSSLASNLQWRDSLSILGIHFSKDTTAEFDLEYNFSPNLKKMESICTDWSKRSISLKGKIVIINTLVLPVIYFQCNMLAVTARIFAEVNRIVSTFLWSGKRPKISKHCLELPTSGGGMGLHNFRNRVASSKISWVKRASRPQREPWQFYLEFKTDMLPYNIFLQRNDPKRIHFSPFFKQILQFWREITNVQPITDMSVRNESLWGNKFLKGKFKKKFRIWCEQYNIGKIQDLIYADQIISLRQFEGRYDVSPPEGLLESFQRIIPQEWLQFLIPINKFTEEFALYVPQEPSKRVPLNSLPTKSFYQMFQSGRKRPYTCDMRWEKVYGDGTFSSILKWNHWHLLPYRTSHSIQLQNFMYRIAYRIIPTRVYLHNIHVIDSELCSVCSLRDDLLHFFFDCVEVKPFWDSLATWVDQNEEIMDFPDDLAEEDFLLGTTSKTPAHYLLNFVIMWAKFYIYKIKIFGNGQLDVLQFLLELKSRLALERLACFRDSSYNKRFKRWEAFYNSF